jgi:hypothetical protein
MRTGTLRTANAPSRSGRVLFGSVEGGRVCADTDEDGTVGGDCGRPPGAEVGVTLAATRQ